MSQKIPTELYAEMTPNPASMKFVCNRALIENGNQVEYTSKEMATGSSPLAAELFNFPFVLSVFISGNYVTVSKDESLGWEMIVQQLRDYVREWLMDNQLAVTSIPEQVLYTPEEDGQAAAVSNAEAVDYSNFKPSQYDDEIRMLLDEFVRPAVEQDGGAIDFKAFDEGKVYVQMRGACSGCPSSMMTLKSGIESLLKANLEVVEEVVAEEA
jgi:Fe-S cluster biogenesis protein NfuA